MALTTLAGIQAGMRPPLYFTKAPVGSGAGRFKTFWAGAGHPGAGGYDTTLNGVTCDNTKTGALFPWVDPSSARSYLSTIDLSHNGNNICMLLLDRLWHNGGFTITSTSAQNITSPTWPARDVAGATSGDGVLLYLEVSATVGAATPTVTISYTNSAGTAGRTATNIEPTTSAQVAGTYVPIGLQAGDTGVKSVESLTLSASWISGTMNLVAARPLIYIEGYGPSQTESKLWSCQAGGAHRLFDGSCLYWASISNTTAGLNIEGVVEMAQG